MLKWFKVYVEDPDTGVQGVHYVCAAWKSLARDAEIAKGYIVYDVQDLST